DTPRVRARTSRAATNATKRINPIAPTATTMRRATLAGPPRSSNKLGLGERDSMDPAMSVSEQRGEAPGGEPTRRSLFRRLRRVGDAVAHAADRLEQSRIAAGVRHFAPQRLHMGIDGAIGDGVAVAPDAVDELRAGE